MMINEKMLMTLNSIPTDIVSLVDLNRQLMELMPPLAAELHIGRIEVGIFSGTPAPGIAPRESRTVIYEADYVNLVHEDTYMMGQFGRFVIKCYCGMGHNWSDDEVFPLKCFTYQLFLQYSRVSLADGIHKSKTTDSLTGVINTAGLMECGGMLKARNMLENYALIFMNFKNFKFVNQRFGADVGDRIIIQFSALATGYLQEYEYLARPGGDNFVALIRAERYEAFITAVNNTLFDLGGDMAASPYSLSIRMGVCLISEEDDMGAAMTKASVACSVAKKNTQTDVVLFKESMLLNSMRNKEIISLFPRAIANNEFEVYYQPKVNMADRKLCGAEGLVRWNHNGNVISPNDFVPIFEKDGMITTLDFYVLEKVCLHQKKLLDMGIKPVRVSSNFSKIHLSNGHLAEDVIAVLKKYDVPGEYIEIELTETSGYEDFAALKNFVRKIRSYGMYASLDDFGTGYSSLNLLKDINVNTIKIDKSFLDSPVPEESKNLTVIVSVISLAKALGLEVVCEGVETEEQADFLLRGGCDIAQGYLYGKPMREAEFDKLIF